MGNEGWRRSLLGRVSRHSGLVLFVDIWRPADGMVASDQMQTYLFKIVFISDDTLIFIRTRGSLNIKDQTYRLAYKQIEPNK
jgi:hypothetical protein